MRDERVGGAGGGRRRSGRIGEGGSAEQPFGAVYSRSFDTGEFFYGIDATTPLGSLNDSTYPWEEGGADRSGGGGGGGGGGGVRDGRFAEPSFGNRENGGGEVPGGTGTASGSNPRRSSHSGAGRGPDRRELSSYADFHAAATATTAPTGRPGGGQEGRGRTGTTPRYYHQRSGSGGGGGSRAGAISGRSGDTNGVGGGR